MEHSFEIPEDIGGSGSMEKGSQQLNIMVMGIGGAGCNAINNMIRPQADGPMDFAGINFVVANTDSQSLYQSDCENKIQLGENITKGLGAGSDPEMGKRAAEESEETIRNIFKDVNMLFITAGLGGGTGTGATPVIANIAREMGILTVAVITKPFTFEGIRKIDLANRGVEELSKAVDSLIVVPNQNLFTVVNDQTSFQDAFLLADQVLTQGVWGISNLMIKAGLVNLDFNDIKCAMQEGGRAMLGVGQAKGEERAVEAARAAISNPLLEINSLHGAQNVIINITGDNITLFEIQQAFESIREQVGDEATISFGAALDNSQEGSLKVLVIATGVPVEQRSTPSSFSRPSDRAINIGSSARNFVDDVRDSHNNRTNVQINPSSHEDKKPPQGRNIFTINREKFAEKQALSNVEEISERESTTSNTNKSRTSILFDSFHDSKAKPDTNDKRSPFPEWINDGD